MQRQISEALGTPMVSSNEEMEELSAELEDLLKGLSGKTDADQTKVSLPDVPTSAILPTVPTHEPVVKESQPSQASLMA